MSCYESHSVLCQAPADAVYELISTAARWPQVLNRCESVEVLASGLDWEVVELTARVHGRPSSWVSERRRTPAVFGVDDQIVRPMPLVESMRTTWRVFDLGDNSSLLLLEHEFEIEKDVAGLVPGVITHDDAARHISSAIDANSLKELADFKAAVELSAGPSAGADIERSRHSVVCVADPDEMYRLVRDTSDWPELFPACVATSARSIPGGEIVTIHALQDGDIVSWDVARTYRDRIRRIDYEFVIPMPLVECMSGTWRVVDLEDGRSLLTVDRQWRILEDVSGIRDAIRTRSEARSYVRACVETNAGREMDSISRRLSSTDRTTAGGLS